MVISAIQKRRGFGLLEVILVFAIVIGAAAVVFTVFQSAKPSADASAEVEHAQLIASNVKSAFGTTTTSAYSTLSTALAIKGKTIPTSMVAADGVSANSAWGAVTVDFDGGNGTYGLCTTSGHCFDIAFYGVPVDACLKFVTGLVASFPDGVKVGNINVTPAPYKLDIPTATTQCAVNNATVLMIAH